MTSNAATAMAKIDRTTLYRDANDLLCNLASAYGQVRAIEGIGGLNPEQQQRISKAAREILAARDSLGSICRRLGL
jgi:hypothetical protein